MRACIPRPFCAPSLLLLLANLAALPVFADTPAVVSISNGDRITGQQVRLADGVVTVETDYAGTLEIAATAVVGIETAEPATVELADGETLVGPLLEAREGALRLGVDGADARVVLLADVTAINPPEVPAVRFGASAVVGANLQRGNAEQTALSAAIEASRETDLNRTELRARWADARDGDRQTAESLFGALTHKRQLSSKHFVFTGVELLSDDFRDLDLRTALNLGVGYKAVDRDRVGLTLEGGLAYLMRDFIVAEDTEELTLRLGLEARGSLGPLELSERLTVYPSFEDDSIQLRNEASLTTALLADWALELSNVLEYDSEPPVGLERYDLLWTLGLQYTLP